jgi:hypothetical protein
MNNVDFIHSLFADIMMFSFFSLILVNSGLIHAYGQGDNNSGSIHNTTSDARIPSLAMDESASSQITKGNASSIAPLNLTSPSSVDIDRSSNSKTAPNLGSSPINELLNISAPLSIKIISHSQNQTVPANKPLEIHGVSSDNANSNCAVYADWNDLEPMQITNASGPNGANDYSTWTFTYDNKYHLITEGTNELTSKLNCDGGLTKYYTVNVIGITEPSSVPNSSDFPLPSYLPASGEDNNNDGSRDDDSNVDDSSGNSNDEDEGEDNQESSDDDNGVGKGKGEDKGDEKNKGEDKGKKKSPRGKNK